MRFDFIFLLLRLLLAILSALQSSILNWAGKYVMSAFKMAPHSSIIRMFARVVKLVYTAGLKPAAANPGMPVRFRSLAPNRGCMQRRYEMALPRRHQAGLQFPIFVTIWDRMALEMHA